MPAPFAWCPVPGMDFAIGKYPVTNAQFDAFIHDGWGYRRAAWWDFSPQAAAWRGQHQRPADNTSKDPQHPRTDVCWYEAVAFTRWLTAAIHHQPKHPVPDDVPGPRIVLPTEAQWLAAANVVAGCESDGGDEPAGKAWEWLLTTYDDHSDSLLSAQARVVRGGAWASGADGTRASLRIRVNPRHRNDVVRFRLGLSWGMRSADGGEARTTL